MAESKKKKQPATPQNQPCLQPSPLDFPVVGLGSSAGGLQALTSFLEQMPADNGMAFVVVMHLSPTHESSADVILQRSTTMRVMQVVEPTPIEKNCVYVIPPNKHLAMDDGHLCVTPLERPVGKHVAIDLFFRTLADVHSQHAYAVVLSGTGSDGAVGIGRIKEQGGTTLVQAPDDAEYPDMPNAAIRTGQVDFILPAVELPQKLIELTRNAAMIQLPDAGPDGEQEGRQAAMVDDSRQAADALRDVLNLLRTRTGHDFRHYKRATILRRIERRMQVRAVPDLLKYRDLLKADAEESQHLLRDMLIGVTQFFRDREVFDTLERDLIQQLFDTKKGDEQLRVWSAGCSTGEEAYSLAMLLADHAATLAVSPSIQVFATDIDDAAIATARAGSYPGAIIADVSPPRLRQYFSKDADRYVVKKTIRDTVLFASHNLLRDPPFSKLDMISCRNLLIYLDREVQTKVLEIFHFALNPDGILLLGNSESADMLPQYFVPVDKKQRIYRAKHLARSSRYTLAMPPNGAIPQFTPRSTSTGDRRKFSLGEVHHRALVGHALPSVILNTQSEIVHMSEGVGRFLRHIGGEPSRNLIALVNPELRLEARTAIFQALQSGTTDKTGRIETMREGVRHHTFITVHPFHDADANSDFLLVLFEEIEEVPQQAERPANGDRDTMLGALEAELQRMKLQLQQTIEHSEVSTEELKASNEELHAINEELRSMTEELSTSKEELQSANEELITVNYELKNTAEETGKINDDLQNLIASTDIATIFVDRGMRIKRYTPRATDIFNIIPADIGRSLHDITHKLDYERLADDATASFDTLRPVEREVRSSDGRIFISRLLPYRTTDDRIEGATLTFVDITGPRKTEEMLRQREARLRLAAESTKDYAIITLDVEGCITSFNKGAERIFSYQEAEVLTQSGAILFTPEDREAGIPELETRRARQEGRAEDERWHVRRDGSRFYCSGVMTPLLDDDQLYGYAKIARDLTGQAHAERQRADQLTLAQVGRAEAQAANLMKDEFLAIMSHELKHPLNLIHMNAELLKRLPELKANLAGARAIETIHSAVTSQAKIINDLLDLSRVNSGKLTLNIEACDLCEMVSGVVALAQQDPSASAKKVQGMLPEVPLMINIDRVRVEQVIWNLIGNALKFTPAGGQIDIALTQEGGQARFDVVDTGVGIDPRALPNVFRMFHQDMVGRAAHCGGLGIGLALVQQIVELHGGRVEATSKGINQGARFSLWLPLEAQPAVAKRSELESKADDGLAGLEVLVLDDQEDSVEVFKILLEMSNAKVTAVSDPFEALKIASTSYFDLVISDIGMPRMDGYDFLRELRKLAGHAATPAIAVTGYGRAKDIELALKAGFSDHVSKPVGIEDILASIGALRKKGLMALQ